MKYWLQDLPDSSGETAPNTFTLTYEDIFTGDWSTTWDDYWIYEGFTININYSDASTINSNNGVEVATTNNAYSLSNPIGSGFSSAPNRTINVYYLRNKYSITFQQGNTVVGSDEYYYEADISGADKYSTSVNVPEGMRFVGWYDNPEGIGDKYTFDGKTMPPNNLILYAKLVPEEYYVRLDYNGGETKGSESTFTWVNYGETIEEAEAVKKDYVEAADDETGTHNYIYWRYDEAADAAGDGWWSYYEDADGNAVYNDPKDYSQRTATYVEAAGGSYKYDPGKYTFVGWYETDENGNQISNVPFNFATRITKDTYLKAVFRKEGAFQVRYLPDMGTEGTEEYVAGDPNTAPPTDSYTYIDLSEAKVGHSIEPADKKYQFAGWRVKGTTEPVYQPGETFPINSDYAEEDNGIQYITLEPVFIQKGDTSITYEVNTPTGATATETTLAGLTDNTQTKLILNGAVTLHDGDGFTVTGYKLIGWSDKPLQPLQNPIHLKDDGNYDGDIPSDTHIFKLGGKYGVSDEEGNTLYAVWELLTIPVPFTKQGEQEDGTYDQLAGAVFELFANETCTTRIDSVYSIIEESDAKVTSSNEVGMNVIFPKAPVGTFYFKETSVGEQYKLDGVVHRIDVVESDDGNHTLSYTIDGTYTSADPYVIKNDLKGTLIVTKTVEGVSTAGTFSFTATLSDKSISGKYGDLTFENGVASFELKHGEAVKIRKLVGKEVTIKENGASVYMTTASAKSGNFAETEKSYTITIPDDGDTVAFTNKLEAQKLRIKKIGDDAPSGLAGAAFSLTAKSDTTIEGFRDLSEIISLSGDLDANNLGYLPGNDLTDTTLFTLPIGNYTLSETAAPENYEGLTEAVSLAVTETGISVKTGLADHDLVCITPPAKEGNPYLLTVKNMPMAKITVNKEWSSGKFVTTHGRIHTALYKETNGTLTLVEGSVRAIETPADSVVYRVPKADLASYVVREVTVVGDTADGDNVNVTAVEPNGRISVSGERTTLGEDEENSYVVTYVVGDVEESGSLKQRTDTITNTMPTLTINKTDLEGHPLKNAVFTLLKEDKETSVTGFDSITSDEAKNGNLLKEIYLSNGVYYLKETNPPEGYNTLEHVLKITVDQNGITMAADTEYAPKAYSDEKPDNDLQYTFRVENNPGVALPSTGGPGTAGIYLLGMLLTSLAGAGMVMSKRLKNSYRKTT